MAQPVRGTQTLVDQMGWVFQRPTLVVLEIAWRWVVGVPLLAVGWAQARAIVRALPPEAAGLADLDTKNPWVAVTQIASAWARYEPHVSVVLAWFLPLALVAWCVASGIGRALVLARMEPGVRFRPMAVTLLQAAWLGLWCTVAGAWWAAMHWNASLHIVVTGEPDLIGFAMWAIVLSLGFFTLWALVSWPLAVAPVLLVTEGSSVPSALGASFKLGKPLTGKLVETSLVMGIVKLGLVVLAMVLSAAPLPFSDQLGPDAMHAVGAGAVLFFLVASDYFHVVRLKGYVEFRRALRQSAARAAGR
ncbi:MAG: hypothetical protein P4L40_10505 [Terracidiphilus sp.]|nr:hypothetical protein [Terracidiphilus sp.]